MLPKSISERVASRRAAHQEDDGKVEAVRQAAAAAFDLEREVEDLKERLARANAKLYEMKSVTIPDLLDEAGLDKLGIPASGNKPALDVKIVPFYQASLPKENPARVTAVKWLTDNGHGDIIKTTVSVDFPREQHEAAIDFASSIEDTLAITPEVSETVHASTYKAWLKEQSRAGKPLPLSELGCFIGRVADLKTRED